MEINLFGKPVFLKKGAIAAVGLMIAVILGGTGYAINNNSKGILIEPGENIHKSEVAGTAQAAEGTPDRVNGAALDVKKLEQINVYIVGCVRKPGIVTLEKGQMIFDAIEAAGGTTDDADLENINMAYKLQDNVMIRVLPKAAKSAANTNTAPVNKPAVKPEPSNTTAAKGIEIIQDSKGAVVGEEPQGGAAAKININTASDKQLDSLPGVGIETAKDIIAYREKNGGFKKPEDIMKISGIKTSKYNKIKDLITVD